MPIEGLYFISSGLARGYYLEDSFEITSFFVKENDFIFANKQFANDKNTSDALEILEPSFLVQISLTTMGKLFDDYPITNKVGRLIAEKYLAEYRQRINALRFLKAEERFRRFVEDFPEFYFRVPQKYIASFLGITPETISRILQRKNSIIQLIDK
jgi:CRP-like cAMP-binding protein